jgi:hypothetical protein
MNQAKKLPDKSEFDPNKHLHWSAGRIVLTIFICSAVSIILVFGFLASQQYQKSEAPGVAVSSKTPAPDTRHYANNYWGIAFDYPGGWSQPIGSYQDGEYYFSSEPINFIGELESGGGLIALKTYNNWQSLPYNEWLKSQRGSFLPAGELSSPVSTTINGTTAYRYTLTLTKPQNNTTLWDVLIISRSTATKYVYILETDQTATREKYLPIFDSLLSSITFTKVESNPEGR